MFESFVEKFSRFVQIIVSTRFIVISKLEIFMRIYILRNLSEMFHPLNILTTSNILNILDVSKYLLRSVDVRFVHLFPLL